MTGEPILDDAAAVRLYAAMLESAELEARRYRLAWKSAQRRARIAKARNLALPAWITLRGFNSYWTAHCLHERCPTGFYAQGSRTHVEDESRQHVQATHGRTS